MLRAHTCASLLAIALAGCGRPVVFEGESTLKITGAPPPAPAVAAPEPPRVELRDNRIVINDDLEEEGGSCLVLEGKGGHACVTPGKPYFRLFFSMSGENLDPSAILPSSDMAR